MEQMLTLKKNLVLIGMPGCGKSSIGKKLSVILNVTFIDIDEYIEKRTGTLIPVIFEKGEPFFRGLELQAVKEVSRNFPSIISTGGGVVKNPENMEYLKENGTIIYINRKLENIIKDLDSDSRPLLKNNLANLYNLYEERYPLYKKYSDYEIPNEGTIESVVQQIMEVVKNEYINP